MLLLWNIKCVSIVQLNFSFSFFNVFFIVIQKVTCLMTSENEKKTKAHKKYYLRFLL